uniref:V-type proton ATPase subunit C n=1 Tax=Mesocestoides corti TaxID=53468 RepID=A0A5K3ETM9_MESCO
MSEFLIISIPADRDPEKAYNEVSSSLSKFPVAQSVSRFPIPLNLKVGTLDVLVGMSDEFAKLDSFADTIVRKVAQYMGDVLEEQKHKLADNLLVGGVSPCLYVSKFQWDTAKYPIKQPLQSLHDILSENLSRIEADLRTRSATYNNIKGNLQAMEKKQTGSLLTRNLAEIVKKQQFVLNSEYLITVAVVVPRQSYKEWEASYESLVDMVVPRSTELIYEDQENGLWTVTLFQKMLGDFTLRAREKKFIVRDFVYDEKMIEESKNALSKLEADKKKHFPPLFRWLRVNFGEAFAAMMHIKALRVFIESVLRFGLPVDFEAILIIPNKKNYKKLREALHNMFEHLDNLSVSSTKDEEIPGPGMSHGEYYPYVSITVETNFVEAH